MKRHRLFRPAEVRSHARLSAMHAHRFVLVYSRAATLDAENNDGSRQKAEFYIEDILLPLDYRLCVSLVPLKKYLS